MMFAAESVETLFQVLEIDREISGQIEELEIVSSHYSQAENEVPHPQFFFAFGLSKTKPDCISDS